ncbi:threonine ammonia-lyase, biosynthetic [Litorimonas sp. WD9-15]|uniref:threonine ammonia-lyase, biosynthetic n=1 Tax=Litorimonas sp. WD9-15 TaxID=3418716 RepID=UPI003D02D815
MSKVNLNDLAARIEAADVYGLAKRTPTQLAPKLSAELGQNIWLKREDLQDVFSFKIRGAANRISGLSDSERARGVVAASAGNHAQGVAAAAQYYGTDALIFMPVTTPPIKVDAVEAMGAKTQLIGDNYDEACAAAIDHAANSGAVFIHPFDEIDVIAGQGTVGREILEQMPRTPAAIYVCTGGGGLVSGIGAWMHKHAPKTKIIAVEAAGAQTLGQSLQAGKVVSLNRVDGFADGTAVRTFGETTFEICKQVVDGHIAVSNDEICAAVKDVFEATRTVVEPAGAQALAGVIQHIKSGEAPEGDLVVTISGANVNFDRIGHVVDRAEFGSGEEMLFAATIPEQAGAFLNFVRALGHRAVTEFNYRYAPRKDAHVLVGLKTRDMEDREQVITDMAEQSITVTDLSHDRLAKRHLRHMVGGRGDDKAEVLYRFEFPERPGALTQFLETLDARWNISLFHYRNHGAAEGHVLCGFHVPKGDVEDLETQLSGTGYPMWPETHNPVYEFFLRG